MKQLKPKLNFILTKKTVFEIAILFRETVSCSLYIGYRITLFQ